MATVDNKAQKAQERFQILLGQFQQSNANSIKNNASPPTNTGEAFKFANKNVNANAQKNSEKKANAKSHAAKANNARIANTPKPTQQNLQSTNLFNLGF